MGGLFHGCALQAKVVYRVRTGVIGLEMGAMITAATVVPMLAMGASISLDQRSRSNQNYP